MFVCMLRSRQGLLRMLKGELPFKSICKEQLQIDRQIKFQLTLVPFACLKSKFLLQHLGPSSSSPMNQVPAIPHTLIESESMHKRNDSTFRLIPRFTKLQHRGSECGIGVILIGALEVERALDIKLSKISYWSPYYFHHNKKSPFTCEFGQTCEQLHVTSKKHHLQIGQMLQLDSLKIKDNYHVYTYMRGTFFKWTSHVHY